MFVNFESDTVPKTSEKVRNSVSPGALDEDRAVAARAAALQPPGPELALRAVEERADGDLRRPGPMRMMRRVPSPPRCWPAPPESCDQRVLDGPNGYFVSKISTGVLRQLPLSTIEQSLPSWSSVPPQPLPSMW